MYGFMLNVVATFMMVMFYASADIATPLIWPQIWTIGSIMVCVGTSWFGSSFVNVSAGSSPFSIMRADLFILSYLPPMPSL